MNFTNKKKTTQKQNNFSQASNLKEIILKNKINAHSTKHKTGNFDFYYI